MTTIHVTINAVFILLDPGCFGKEKKIAFFRVLNIICVDLLSEIKIATALEVKDGFHRVRWQVEQQSVLIAEFLGKSRWRC